MLQTNNQHSAAISFSNNQSSSSIRLQKLLDSSLDVICAIDKEGRFKEVSMASLHLWGYHPDELIGKYYMELVVEEDRPKTKKAEDGIVQGTKETNFENRYKHKDGRIVPLVWSAQWDAEEQTMIGVARDASEKVAKEELQAKYEQEIQQQNSEMREMLERITDGFFALDNDWRFLYGNSQVEKMLNIKQEDYIGRNYWECFPQVIGTEYQRQYLNAMSTMEPVHFKAFFPPFSRWFSVDAFPSHTGLSIFFRDLSEQQKMEEDLRISNERFRLAAKSDAIYDWDLLSHHIDWGEGLLKLFGYHSHELQYQQWEQTIHPDDYEMVIQSLQTSIEDKAAPLWKAEYRLKRKDNTYCYVFERAHIVRDEEGKAIRMVGVMQDITERKKAEAEHAEYERKIEQQHEQMTNVLERMKQGFFSIDKEYRVQYWNRHAEEIIGVSRQEVLGKVLLDWYCEEASILYRSLYEQAVKEQAPVSSEHVCPQTKRWVEVSIYPSEDGFSVFFKDIDNKKRAEEELQMLSLVAKETINAVSLVEPDGKVIWVNESFAKITGYSLEETIGQKHIDLLRSTESNDDAIKKIHESFCKGEPFTGEVLCNTKDNRRVWLETSGQPVFDNNGNFIRFFIIQTDITERKQLEFELKEQQKKINAAVIAAQEKERSQVGRELHDNVNQVLTTVKLYTELCRDGIGNATEMMNKSIKLLQDSINEIRSLSKRLSAPSLGSIKLKESVNDLIEAVAATGKIAIFLEGSAIENVEVDHEMHLAVYRILQEHLTNIIKHAEAKKVHIIFNLNNGKLLLKVTDDGKGFDTRQKRDGIGIANMITRAESLKGTLAITSSPRNGCELELQFPLEV